jgi:CelD/BcsL family acetyltransferase involved in cellulose biosynthesis
MRTNARYRAIAGQWRGEIKRVGDLSADEIALWRLLSATHHALRSPFFSFEFTQAVAETAARARVCLLYENMELGGFFPFQFADRFTQSMRAGERIGGELNDFCGVVIDPARYRAIGAQDILRCAGLASFEVSHLEEHQLRRDLRASPPSQGARIKLEYGPQNYWESVKSSHPSDYETLRRRERKIEREFRRVEFIFAHEAPSELLDLVVAEKRNQYERSGAGDGFAEPWKLRCLDRIARYRDGGCVPVLSALYFDGEWAALHFGARAGKVLHYWFPVYNPQFSGLSPGLILLAKMIREAAAHSIAEIDLGEGLSRYKELFATETYPLYRDVWYRASPRGLAYRGYLSLSWRTQRLRKRANDYLAARAGQRRTDHR